MRRTIALLMFATALCVPARADITADFDAANEAYAAGDFRAAADGYAKVAAQKQWSAALFYNLANSYFRLGDFGRAILNYERALTLEPKHPEAEANLRIVRDRARALELVRTTPERYAAKVAVNDYAWVAAGAFWVALFAAVTLWFRRGSRSVPAALFVSALLILAAAFAAIYLLENGSHGRALAVVVAKDVQARLATAENAGAVLALPPGSEVKVLSTRGEWIYAALPNQLRGWIPAKSAERVRL